MVAAGFLSPGSTFMILSASLLALTLAAAQTETQATPVAAVSPSPVSGTVAEHATPASETRGTMPVEKPAGDHAASNTAAKEGSHDDPASILMHHVTDQPNFLGPVSKHLFFMMLVMGLVIIAARAAAASYKDGAPRGFVGSAIETLVVYVRDEIAEKNIGHGDGLKFTPLLLSFFFFILFAALVGLVPFSGTSTGNLSVTFGLAFISFLAQQYAGLSKYGIGGHFKNLIPHGLPLPLVPVIGLIEFAGMFIKPAALMIRLFANMLAGHVVITALLMLVPLSAKIAMSLGLVMIPVSLGMALFIMCLEVLVAFIQAYVFTLLSAIFIGMFAHPSH